MLQKNRGESEIPETKKMRKNKGLEFPRLHIEKMG